MYSNVYGADIHGIHARIIKIEADISDGLPFFCMVGYLSSAVKEARERVEVAMKNAGYPLPAKRITVSLSPASFRKEGSNFDFPVAVSLLQAANHIPSESVKDSIFIGELGLDGSIRPVRGVLPIVLEGKEQGIQRLFVPIDNVKEASVIPAVEIYGIASLAEFVSYARGKLDLKPASYVDSPEEEANYDVDYGEIIGMEKEKRAMEIAVSGRHNLLLMGPPGSGKTMLAQRIPTIMPDMTWEEQLILTKIYSVCGMLDTSKGIMKRRPFRSPHHSITGTTLIGGGVRPQEGEVTLGSFGCLFLDEFLEFPRKTMELLRQPMEERKVVISRLGGTIEYPAETMFVLAMNPCPCGFYPNYDKCHCSPHQVERYRGKLSKAILDRIDLCIETKSPKNLKQTEVIDSKTMKKHVEEAWRRQQDRFLNQEICFNAQMDVNQIKKYCIISPDSKEFLDDLYKSNFFTLRGMHRVIKVARTIADLAASEHIELEHCMEAIGLRGLETNK